jgi:hypothetical protein
MSSQNNQQSESSISPAIIIVCILAVLALIFAFGSGLFGNKEKTNDAVTKSSITNTISSNAAISSISSVNPEETKKMAMLEALVGSYNGESTLLSNFLSFPKTNLNITKDLSLSINGSGLDLAVLNNPKLQVSGQYPTVKIMVKGTLMPTDATKGTAKITSISPSFVVKNGETEVVLDQATSTQILSGIAEAGIVVPEASENKPLVVNLNMTLSPSKILIANDKESLIVVKFSGTK